MLNSRIYRNVWRVKKSYPISVYTEMYGDKNHAQFPYIQKCMGEKKSCPISVAAEMYGEINNAQFM